ncbi:MAG TPA: hypothetical protein VE153_09250 [Myxococcus sp.]|nr:hypothetical protein [Myxococcus sp.]
MPRGPTEPPASTPTGLQDERLRRLEEALAEGRAREAAAVEAWVRQTGRMPSKKVRRKWEKKWRKQAQREAQRAARGQRETSSRSPAQGAAYAAIAITCLVLALGQPRRLWWLVFVALGFFLSAAKHLERRGSRGPLGRDAERGPPAEGLTSERTEARVVGREVGRVRASAEVLPSGREVARRRAEALAVGEGGASEDPRGAKVDVLCGKLLTELREGPPVLREVVHAPERTVEALRQGCHVLARRERELRALSAPEETQRLESEREALAARIASEADVVVRERLTGALAALDEQRRQRAELVLAANRLEAEHTRLYYTLESVYAQVLRVRTADAAGQDVVGAGLRQGVERLGEEVEAVARALEEVHREPPPPDGRVRTR